MLGHRGSALIGCEEGSVPSFLRKKKEPKKNLFGEKLRFSVKRVEQRFWSAITGYRPSRRRHPHKAHRGFSPKRTLKTRALLNDEKKESLRSVQSFSLACGEPAPFAQGSLAVVRDPSIALLSESFF